MGEVDRQRISAVRTLEALGYSYHYGEGWRPPQASEPSFEADALYELVMKQADRICCIDDPQEDAEFWAIVKALEAYETKRWPDGNESRGKE
jgi:hypothetical protein